MSYDSHGRGRGDDSTPNLGEPVAPSATAAVAAARFDVVALVSSAGGLEALRAILRDLPPDFPVPIVIGQHLGGQGSALVQILRRLSTLPVAWAATGMPLTPGRVVICPPRRQLEILPDGTCSIDSDGGVRDHPLDGLLESIADSFGSRALAVVLTGMGSDASAGAAAIKRAGGIVLVQSEESAEQPSMPRAVIARGAADLILPLYEIASVIATAVRGGDLPRPRAEVDAVEALFAGDGEVRQLLREMDWARTPLGLVQRWPVSLRTTLRLVLDSPMPKSVLWGPDLIQLYNDEYRLVMGTRHPAGLARPMRACWPEVWHLNEPIYARVLSGEAVALSDALYPITRRRLVEDAWFDLYFTPVRGDAGMVEGVLTTIVETTGRVLSQRRLRTLQALTAATAGATSVHLAMQRAIETLCRSGLAGDSAHDVPFVAGYLLDHVSRQARLVDAAGVDAGGPMAPRTIDLVTGSGGWPFAGMLEATGDRSPVLLEDLAARFRGMQAGPHATPTAAILLPLQPVADEPPAGIVVCGINPRLVLDDVYRAFFDLVAARISASIGEAQVRQKERERLERLADLDRAKTEFFSNVSHEFRTPLTLLMAPLDELSRRREQLPEPLGEEVHVASRNARRLLNQVNTLLDFSQADAGRLRAQYEPADLAVLTRDIASVFRSAADRAGIAFRVACPPLPEPVWVDPQMWEKIVSNLLSNALKFTFTGEIAVTLTMRAKHAELLVSDTGVGIPADEQPHVFKRFHRVRGRRGRTNEGTGIGLALVHELVRLHQGRVRLQSVEGEGTTMTVWIPVGRRHRTDAGLEVSAAAAAARLPDVATATATATAMAAEAAGWAIDTDDEPAAPPDVADDLLGPPTGVVLRTRAAVRTRVVIVDDNADMRDYLRRLLQPHSDVVLASDGVAALAAIRRARPDVVIADVMMPGLDGFELLTRIRGDAALKYTPVILVTARAGETAAIEGLRAGADDYLAKPFSPRELVARVQAVIERSHVEAEVRDRAAWLHGQRAALEAAVNGAPLEVSLDALVKTMADAVGEGTRARFHLANEVGTARHHVEGTGDDYARAGEGCWSFPIHSAVGRFVGTFAVYATPPREPGPRDLELASLLTQTASIIIARQTESQARQQAEAVVRASEARLAADVVGMRRLHELHQRLANETSLQAALQDIVNTAVAFANTDRGTIQLRRDGEGGLEIVAEQGERDDRYVVAHATPMVTRAGERIGMLSTWYRQPYDLSEDETRLTDLLAWTAAEFVERHRADAALRQTREDALRELAGATHLHRVSGLLIEPGGQPFHDQILDAAIAITGADFGSIQRLDEAAGVLTLLAWRNFHPESAAYWRSVPLTAESTGGSVLRSGKRLIVPDVRSAAPDVLLGTGSLRHYELSGIRALQATPLITRDGRLVGMISTLWRDVHTPVERELRLLDILARQAADFFERRAQ